MTASTVFVEDTVGAMQTYTLIEVLRNETLENSTTENGSQTILEYVTSQLCPGNCNKNGNCTFLYHFLNFSIALFLLNRFSEYLSSYMHIFKGNHRNQDSNGKINYEKKRK